MTEAEEQRAKRKADDKAYMDKRRAQHRKRTEDLADAYMAARLASYDYQIAVIRQAHEMERGAMSWEAVKDYVEAYPTDLVEAARDRLWVTTREYEIVKNMGESLYWGDEEVDEVAD